MVEVPLQALPNQSLTIRLDQSLYVLTIKEVNGVMAMTIVRDNIIVLSNARIVPGYPIIPYAYKEDGNFILLTANEEYPYYTEFGITQSLIFATQAEIEVLRAT